jgi:capsular exopolysaccharide synthesis family protein
VENEHDERLLTVLWRGRYLIVVSTVVAIGLALALTLTAENVYRATTTILVSSPPSPGTAAGNAFDAQLASQGLALTYAALLEDRSFLDSIRGRVAGGRLTTEQLRDRLAAKVFEDTVLVELRADAASPEAARSLAADVAGAFVETVHDAAQQRSAQLESEIEHKILELTAQIEALEDAGGGTTTGSSSAERLASLQSARDALSEQLASVVASGIQEGGSVALAAAPTASPSPVRPRRVLNLGAGLLCGLFVGLGLAWLRVRLDQGLHSSKEAGALLDAPVLASVPLRKKQTSFAERAEREAFDVLRANVTFVSPDDPPQVVVCSSYRANEGKTSTLEGLARAAVRAGIPVLLIDGDLRTRSLSARLGHEFAAGLTNAIAGTIPAEELIVPITDGLSLLPAGTAPPNPPSLLSSGRTRDLMAQLRESHSLILIDSPPLVHLADGSIIASLSDGVVLVARVGVTKRDDLLAAVANLRHGPAPVLGLVVFEPRAVDETYYPAATRSRTSRTRAAIQP